MPDLDSLIPEAIRKLAVKSGSEWLYPRNAINQVIAIADDNEVAILGVEVFRILSSGLQTEAISGYELPFSGDWKDFANKNNALALEFVRQTPQEAPHTGYILTAVDKDEFVKLTDRPKAGGPR